MNKKKQNRTTKDTKKQEGKKRSDTKYPGIVKKKNLPSRQDYIEPYYINGVLDQDDNIVIRPLTEKELEFLNKFYEETISTNFLHNDKLRKLNSLKRQIIEDSTVFELKKTLEEALKQNDKNQISVLKKTIKLTKKQNEEIYADKLEEIEEEIQQLREEYLLHPDKEQHKELYKENNSRNSCLFNKYKTAFKLDHLDEKLQEYYVDDFYKNTEDDIIDQIEREKWEDEEERLKKAYKKKSD